MSLGKIWKLPFFPKLFTYSGTKLQVDFMDSNDVKDIYNVIQKRFMDKAMGLSVGEIKDEQHLCDILQKSDIAAKISDITDSFSPKTVGVINIEPQNICRSAAPITHGGYVVMDSYKDIKPGKDMLATFAMCGRAAGYLGLNTRSALKYPPSVGVNLSIGSIVCGVLPRSGHLVNYSLSDEVIIHQDYSIACPHLPQAQMTEDQIITRAKAAPIYKKYYSEPFKPIDLSTSLPANTVLQPANPDDISKVYKLFMDAASESDGIGLDEFPTMELFTEKYLHYKSLLVIKDVIGDIVGAAVVGPCHISRGINPETAIMYLYIHPGYRKRGIGRHVIRELCEYLPSQGYTGLVTETLVTEGYPHGFLRKMQFYNTGCIHYSAYVKHTGWTHSALYFKDFKQSGIPIVSHFR